MQWRTVERQTAYHCNGNAGGAADRCDGLWFVNRAVHRYTKHPININKNNTMNRLSNTKIVVRVILGNDHCNENGLYTKFCKRLATCSQRALEQSGGVLLSTPDRASSMPAATESIACHLQCKTKYIYNTYLYMFNNVSCL